MASDDTSQERTEEATPKKAEEARGKGQIETDRHLGSGLDVELDGVLMAHRELKWNGSGSGGEVTTGVAMVFTSHRHFRH